MLHQGRSDPGGGVGSLAPFWLFGGVFPSYPTSEITKHIAPVRRRRKSACPGRTRRRTFPTPSRSPCGLSAPAVAISNRLQNRCPLLQDTLMFDPVQAPSLRHAFESVNAAILEADFRL